MSRFEHVLRQVERELPALEPMRSETLLELGADLEDAYQRYRSQGLTEVEAAARAETLLVLDNASIGELQRLHAPWYESLLGRSTLEMRVQRAGFLILSGVVVLASVPALMVSDLLRDPPPAVWLLAASCAGILASAANGWLEARAGRRNALTLNLRRLTALCAFQFTIAMFSAVHALATLAGGAALQPATVVFATVGRAAELLTLSLCVCLIALLAAFPLRRRALELARLHADVDQLLTPLP